MKKLNRNMLKLSVYLLILGAGLAVISVLTNSYTSILGYAGLAALVVGMVMKQIFSRCPHCGRFVQGISAFSDAPGSCPSCHGKLEFDS